MNGQTGTIKLTDQYKEHPHMDIDAKLRPFYIAKILYERTDEDHYLTTNQLIKILEEEYKMTSYRATIASDIAMLNELGMNISEVKSTQNRYKIIRRKLSLAEIKLLIDAIHSSKFISKDKSAELTEKLCSFTSTYQAEKLERNLSVEGQVKGSNERLYMIIDTINDAINSRHRIKFFYSTYIINRKSISRKQGDEHVFSPFYLVWNGDYYYVIGWSDTYEKVVQFRVDRIETIPEILEAKAHTVPASFRLNKYINTMFHMYDSERSRVKLVCENSTANAIADKFGEHVAIEKTDENHFTATVTVAVNHIFYSWIFGFGGKVRIAGPEEVASGYQEMLRNALGNESV